MVPQAKILQYAYLRGEVETMRHSCFHCQLSGYTLGTNNHKRPSKQRNLVQTQDVVVSKKNLGKSVTMQCSGSIAVITFACHFLLSASEFHINKSIYFSKFQSFDFNTLFV